MSVTLRNTNDPKGQIIRNIWEKPTTAAGHATAALETASRISAGRGAGIEAFVEGFAHPEDAVTDEQYQLVVDALFERQRAYEQWLQAFLSHQQQ